MDDYIQFNFRVSQLANFYFFVQNLSEWHFSNCKQYNEVWRKQLSLGDRELSMLKKFSKLHQRYSFGPKYLGNYFLFHSPQQAWKSLHSDLPELDFIFIKEIFDLLEPKFRQIWRKEGPRLREWKLALQGDSVSPKSKTIERILGHFYQWHIGEPIQTDIILMLATNGFSGGGANFMNNPYALQLEISSLSVARLSHVLMLIWHELAHVLIIRHTDFIHRIQSFLDINPEKAKTIKRIQNRQKPAIYINELILSSLLPTGCLRAKVFGKESYLSHNFKDAPRLFQHVLRLSKEYLEKQQSVDLAYLGRLLK